MLFNSYIFVLLMLPLCIIGYYQLNKCGKYTLALIYLLGMSLWFIGYMNIMYLLVVVPSVVVNYIIAKGINGEWADNSVKRRKMLTAIGIILDLLVLFIFKYYNFFAESFNEGLRLDIPTVELLMPLGISFYTFQEITYLVDCYRDSSLKHSFLDYALYICFFPQFIQGPIVLQSELIPQFSVRDRKSVDYSYMSRGLYRFVLGLSKKVLLADNLALIADIGYREIYKLGSLSAVISILAYTLQIYFDFSGYSDMAIGIANMLHIDLPENFDSPYKACSIDEFWDRWHITLTRFFTRYIYIPLGGSRKGRARTYANIFFIFLISGLWHGAEWSFVLWGIMHGIAMIISRAIREIRSGRADGLTAAASDNDNNHDSRLSRIISGAVTFTFVNIAWVFFRAADTSDAIKMIKHIFAGGWTGLDSFLCEAFENTIEASLLSRMDVIGISSKITGVLEIIFVIILTFVVVFAKNSRELTEEWRPNKRSAMYIIALGVWCILSFSGVTTFVYWNF